MSARMSVDELAWAICGDETGELRARLAGHMEASPRFRTFVEEHRDKIRKKARVARAAEGLRDLALELEAAYRLLGERRFALRYEPYAASGTRGPDFAVLYKERHAFNVEVKRLRAFRPAEAGAFGKWTNAVCDKAAQMPPSIANVALLAADGVGGLCAFEASVAMARLRQIAERGDDAFFAQRGYRDARDFLRTLPRLSAVLYIAGWDADAPDAPPLLWLNALARHPLPAEVARMLVRAWPSVADLADTVAERMR